MRNVDELSWHSFAAAKTLEGSSQRFTGELNEVQSTLENQTNSYQIQAAREVLNSAADQALRDAYFPDTAQRREQEQREAGVEPEQDRGIALSALDFGMKSLIEITNLNPLPGPVGIIAGRIFAIQSAA